MPHKKTREPAIGREGLRRNLGEQAILYRWNQTPRNVRGTVGECGGGFSVGGRRRYAVENGQRIALYINAPHGADALRFYDVVL